MSLVWKVAAGAGALAVLVVLMLLTVYWWAPVGINNYANKVSVELALNSPELLTRLGLGDNTIVDFHSGWLDDHTEAGEAKEAAIARRARKGLDAYGPKGLEGRKS